MVTGKAAFFVEGNSERAVAGADLQYMVSAFVFSKKIFNKLFGIAFALRFRCSGYVFYFQDAVAFVCNHAFRLDAVIVKYIHGAFVQIAVNHAFLFIGQEQQGKILFFIFCDFADGKR